MLANTFVSGQNADMLSLKMILQNQQTVTIAKSPKTTGYAIADLATKLATKSNKKIDMDVNATTFNGDYDVPSILFEPVVVSKTNLEKVILNDGFINKSELYSNN